jgi:hypothetical protein
MSATTASASSQRRRAVGVRLLAVVASLLLVSLLVINNSRAAFTDATDPATGDWSSAGVEITEASNGTTFFTASGLVPGDFDSASNVVTYVGSAASVDVRLYAGAVGGDAALADELNLKIGTTEGGTEVYSGTVSDFAATVIGWESAAPAIWQGVAPGQTRTYYFEVQLKPGAPDSVQDKTATLGFIWEAQSNPTQNQ